MVNIERCMMQGLTSTSKRSVLRVQSAVGALSDWYSQTYEVGPPPLPLPVMVWVRYYSVTRGRLASTGLVKEWQRAQVQVPGKTVWNDLTANTELALAA